MDFELSSEQRRLRDDVVAFARESLAGDAAAAERRGGFDTDRWRRCGEEGLLGLPVPPELGGAGAGALEIAVALEALGYGCEDNGLLFAVNAHLWGPVTSILHFGSEGQKRRYLPLLADGSLVGAQAATEAAAGSDVFALETTAERCDGGFVLNGAKRFVTNAPAADLFVVLATCDPGARAAGLGAFVVERGAEGLEVGAPVETMGLRSAAVSGIALHDCAVPAEAVLGEPGDGMAVFGLSIQWERTFVLACAVGTMQRQLEKCVAHARRRRQFGKPIMSFQAVSHRLAEMKLRLELARLLLYRGAFLLGRGRASPLDAALVKLYLSESFVASSLDAVAIHGGDGYTAELEFERELRDALGSRAYGGTSEIQRNVIAGSLGSGSLS